MATQIDRLGGAKGSLAYKAPCRVATTANITLSGLQTIDGVTLVTYDRVLVKDQTDATTNGIYCVQVAGWERAKDFNGNSDVVKGTRVDVTDGSVGFGEYKLISENDITIGTSNITFEKQTPVIGPASSVDDNLPTFSGTSGALLQDSGVNITTVVTTADIGSTGTNGVQQYFSASTDALQASDIGSTSSANAVQGYVGSTATVITTGQIGSTTLPSVQPGYAQAPTDLGSFTADAQTLTVGTSDGAFQYLSNDLTSTGTLTIGSPQEYGRFYLEVTNGTSPGTVTNSTDYSDRITGTPSTEAGAVNLAVLTRHFNIHTLEWQTT